MVINIIKSMNWVDIFIAILISRIIYNAVKKGFIVEMFKLLGSFTATYLALHYYARLGNYLQSLMLGPPKIPLEFWDFLSLIVLSLLGYTIFLVIREAVSRMIKMEAISTLNKWGAAILGVGRGVLACALVIFIFVNPTLGYFRNSVMDSYLGSRFLKVAPEVYRSTWDNLMSKFMSAEEFNKSVIEIQENKAK